VGEHRCGIAQARKAEERRDGLAGGKRHGGEAALDLIGRALQRHGAQVQRMRPGVRAHGMAAAHHFLDHVGIGLRHLPHIEERRLGAELVERVEDGLGVFRHWAVVEGQHDLLWTEEARLLLVLGEAAEQGTGLRVDLDDARHAQGRLRIGAGLFGRRRDARKGGGSDQRQSGQAQTDQIAPRSFGIGELRTTQ
jgi:hypothetical protein